MTAFAFPVPQQPSAAIRGQTARFPVRRIFCVGRNYAEHAREMGHDPEAEPPFFFIKPADALVPDGACIPYPAATRNLHFEAELVVALGRSGHNLTAAEAPALVWGYAPGNDLTRRDLQAAAKDQRRPWDMAKSFDRSAVLGALVPVAEAPAIHAGRGALTCTVNGAPRQSADIADMIWPVPAILAFLSQLVELQPGDLIFTGTPAGVGALQPGDSCSVAITGLGAAKVSIAPS